MKKILSLALILLLSLAFMVGCSQEKQEEKKPDQAQDTPKTDDTGKSDDTDKKEEPKEINIEHAKGSIKLESAAKKIVVFDMGGLDTVDAIAPDIEIAVPTSNIPKALSKYENAVNAGSLFEPDMEAIFNFEPDLIIIGARQADYYDEFSKIAPTIYVEINADTYMDDFKLSTLNIARAIGKEDEAKKYLDEIDKEIEAIKELSKSSEKKSLIIMTNDGNISAYGKGSRFGLIHDVLGIPAVDETIKVSNHGQEASFEYIAQVNPEILFVIDRTAVAGGSAKASDTLNNDLVKSVTAYKNNKIIYLNAEAWYLANGGINMMNLMLSEVKSALN